MIDTMGLDPVGVSLRSPAQAASQREDKLKTACRQVESLFVNELFAAMSKSTFGEGMTGTSTAREIFIAQRNSALAEELGKRGDLGMARMLYEELLRGMQSSETQTGELDGARGIAVMAGKEETGP